MNLFSYLLLCIAVEIYGSFIPGVLDFNTRPPGSAFLLTRTPVESEDEKILLTTASNIDSYVLYAKAGDLTKQIKVGKDLNPLDIPFKVFAQVLNREVEEETKTIYFLCHAFSLVGKSNHNESFDICCVMSVNTSFSHEFTSCVLNTREIFDSVACHASMKLPAALWREKIPPFVTVSYTYFAIRDFLNPGRSCSSHSASVLDGFRTLPAVTVVRSVSDAIRQLGRNILLQVPRRELRITDEFFVPVRLKHSGDVLEFTLRCEIPANSYVEFVRVIWPGGLKPSKESDQEIAFNSQLSGGSSQYRFDGSIQNVWDIFHRSVLGQKRNVTEIVARFREDLIRVEPVSNYSPASEVYKILFKVLRPTVGSAGRVAPRIFWNLVSLSQRNSADRTVGGSPIVTRLNIESSELKYLAMAMKTSALVNLATLTGKPTTYPVWVYGLTHDGTLTDVTERATCHTGDDAVIHFANDSCSKLGFSGAELDGSPGLPLVAKLDGRSASISLLVWFPKPPAIRLVVGQETISSVQTEKRAVIHLRRMVTGTTNTHSKMDYTHSWNTTNHQTMHNQTRRDATAFYQHLPVRILARFILAGSVLYDKDVLGGKIDQYVDVTEYTAHRIQILNNDVPDKHFPGSPVELKFLPSTNQATLDERTNDNFSGQSKLLLIGRGVGGVQLRLKPLNLSDISTFIPPGLQKQLKDQKEKAFANSSDGIASLATEPEIQVTVQCTNEKSIWPVGISAQFLRDFSLEFSPVLDSSLSWDSQFSGVFREQTLIKPQDDFLPLTSGLYSINVDYHGGRLMHSGAIHKAFGQETRLNDPSKLFGTGTHSMAGNRTIVLGRPKPSVRSDDNIALIVLWIHFSDGSSVLWNHLVELYETMKESSPFKLSIANLQPQLFEVTGPSIVHVDRKRRRRSHNKANRDPRMQRLLQEIGVGTRRRQNALHYSSPIVLPKKYDSSKLPSTDQLMSDATTHTTWFGPIVRIRRDRLSYTGDGFELGLLSLSGELLVPKLRLPVDIMATQLSNDAQVADTNENIDVPNRPLYQNPADINNILRFSPQTQPVGNAGSQLNSNSPAQHLATNEGTNSFHHNLLAFKDAPGLRGQQLHVEYSGSEEKKQSHNIFTKQSEPGALYEAPFSDQNEEGRPNVEDSFHRDKDRMKSEHDNANTSRPALEMSMYILLGLFALVGLVFAVNCGAAVARYRWERSSRRRSSQSNEVAQQKNDHAIHMPVTPEKISRQYGDSICDGERNPMIEQPHEQTVFERCKRLMWQHRTKHKPVLHRDNNWVWISRDKAAAAIGASDQSMISGSAGGVGVSNSPVLQTSNQKKNITSVANNHRTVARSQSYGNSRCATTAVLSIGEADMLLTQSPRKNDQGRDNGDLIDDEYHTHSNTPNALIPSHLTRNLWRTGHSPTSEQVTSHTLGRCDRRYTTGTLMQRNYPGHECSIRIISNPVSEQIKCYSTKRPAQDQLNLDYNATLEFPGLSTGLLIPTPNQTAQGCASTSLRGRRTKDSTKILENHVIPTLMNEQQLPLDNSTNQLPMFMEKSTLLLSQYIHPALLSINPRDGATFEAMMWRSWLRPKSTKEPFITHPDYPTNPFCRQISEPNSHVRNPRISGPLGETFEVQTEESAHESCKDRRGLDKGRESMELGLIRSPNQPGERAPYPPVRTTSRATNSRTLDSQFRKNELSIKHRPMSLPQSFQVSNELYSMLAGTTNSNSTSALESRTHLNSTDVQDSIKANPSEESLWWYHPIRQPRRRKRYIERNAWTTLRTSQDQDQVMKRKGLPGQRMSWETLDYACPATCDCNIHIKGSENLDGPGEHKYRKGNPCVSSAQPNLSSVSDLAWDQELLALSHDRLVAYFAGMKESNA